MNEAVRLIVATTVVMWFVLLILVALVCFDILNESRKWRHLVQLYYEARLRKQLPVDVPADHEISSLALPKDLQQQLAARDVEKHQ